MTETAAGASEALVPIFCAHEHWGSVASMGQESGTFRPDARPGALPERRTTIIDLVVDPYFGGWLGAAGINLDSCATAAGARSWSELVQKSPAQAYQAIGREVGRQSLTGGFQCLRRGIQLLYDVDLLHADGRALAGLDRRIGRNYEALFDWYGRACRVMKVAEVLRPVHPIFYLLDDEEGRQRENPLIRSLLRIDPLLEMWATSHPIRDRLSAALGVDPAGPAEWREFLSRLMDRAAARGAVGIKQLQAYRRPLAFSRHDDSSVRFRGALSPAEATAFEDWMVHACCELADARGWPHQVHVGTHNLAQSSPLPLQELATRYRRMSIVQLHCWPFLREAGWLAKHLPNVYIDTCWMPILNPDFLREALAGWVGYMPWHKIMCSQDATSVEMAAGSALFTREALQEALGGRASAAGLGATGARVAIRAMLHDNAAALYGERKAGLAS